MLYLTDPNTGRGFSRVDRTHVSSGAHGPRLLAVAMSVQQLVQATQHPKVTMHHSESETRLKTQEATSDEWPWAPSSEQLIEIAVLSYNQNDFTEIMDVLQSRLKAKPRHWQHVAKALTVIEYLLRVGTENVVLYFTDRLHMIEALKTFQYVDRNCLDGGAVVRQKAEDICYVLRDSTRTERKRGRMIRWHPSGDGDEELGRVDGGASKRIAAPSRRDRQQANNDGEVRRLVVDAPQSTHAAEQFCQTEEKLRATRLDQEEEDTRCNQAELLAGINDSNTPFSSSNTHGLQSYYNPPPDLTSDIIKTKNQYIAGGGFGDVYKCRYRGSSVPVEVAVKAFRFTFTMSGDKSMKMLRRELGIWRRLKHGNIVPFLGITYGFGMDGAMSLVSLWMSNESLYKFLTKHEDSLSVAHRLQFLLDISKGLHYLHSSSILHGDLNCNNVLLDAEYTARLTDFGYASLIGNIPEALTYLQRSTSRPGALRWIAPEQVNSDETFSQTTKSDIYSFGCVALQVLSGKLPWSEVREDAAVVLRLAKGQKPARPASPLIDDSHWDLIQRCLSSIEERPTAETIIPSIRLFLVYSAPSPSLSDLFGSPITRTESQQMTTPAQLHADTPRDSSIHEVDTSMNIQPPPPNEPVQPSALSRSSWSPKPMRRSAPARPRREIPPNDSVPTADASMAIRPFARASPSSTRGPRVRDDTCVSITKPTETQPNGLIWLEDASTAIQPPPMIIPIQLPHPPRLNDVSASRTTQAKYVRRTTQGPHAGTPSNGFIRSEMDASWPIQLPPLHELVRPPSPLQRFSDVPLKRTEPTQRSGRSQAQQYILPIDDGWIPRADASNTIRLPPPHELTRPPPI